MPDAHAESLPDAQPDSMDVDTWPAR